MTSFNVLTTIVLLQVTCHQLNCKEGRGIEDTGFGICHSYGMGPTNLSLSDIVEVPEPVGHRWRIDETVEVTIHWPELVARD